ncbi:MAG TPA: hypothetical protein VF468_11575 [Actinomycetota bacterium]|nr:hypothetical protein [Actinomycetota bacterium]
MAVWETDPAAAASHRPRGRSTDRAGGRQGRVLPDAGGGLPTRTRIERDFDPERSGT